MMIWTWRTVNAVKFNMCVFMSKQLVQKDFKKHLAFMAALVISFAEPRCDPALAQRTAEAAEQIVGV